MGILGVGIVAKSNLEGNPRIYVEYRKCDRCGAEFRLYYKSPEGTKRILQEIAANLGSTEKEDICHSCMSEMPADQMVMVMGDV